MKMDKIRQFAVPVLYVVAITAFVGSMFFIQKKLTDMVLKEDDPNFEYVSKDNPINNEKPVDSQEKVIVKPYLDESVRVLKSYYDYKAEADTQQKSLVYYEKTYMQNSGVDYQGNNPLFEVVSILDGTVINVKEDNLLGKYIEVRHSNDMISVYQSLSEVTVKKDDQVKQGQVLGKSGTSNISSALNDHLHFEIIYKGQIVNPEEFYNKKVTEL